MFLNQINTAQPLTGQNIYLMVSSVAWVSVCVYVAHTSAVVSLKYFEYILFINRS